MIDGIKRIFKSIFSWLAAGEEGKMPAFFRSRFFSGLALCGFAVAASIMTTLSLQRVPESPVLGTIADRDIKVDRDYEIIDDEATTGFRQEASSSVIALYTFDLGMMASIANRVHEAFREARPRAYALAARAEKGRKRGEFVLSPDDESLLKEGFVKKLGILPSEREWRMLIAERFNSRVEGTIVDLIEQVMEEPIVAERGTLDAEKGRGIIIRRTRRDEGKLVTVGETRIDDISAILSTDEVRSQILATRIRTGGLFDTGSQAAIVELASHLVEPNCIYERQETEERRAQAAANVKDVIIRVAAGEMIIRNGSRFEPWHLKVLRGIHRERGRGTYPYEFLGTFLVVLMLTIIPFSFGQKFLRRFHPSRADYALMAAIALMTLLVIRLSLAIAPAVQQAFFVPLPDRIFTYAVPIAAGAMLIRMLLTAESALMFAISMALMTGLFAETGLRYVVFALISNVTALVAVARVDRRTLIIRAGAVIGLVNAILVLGLKLMNISTVTESLTAGTLLWFITCAFAGGITSALLTMIVLPVVESVSGYVTDIKLLELANLNHPLLRELIVRAPGTYHHSHLVGILAEAAAEAIGANVLLVRVGAYYHDIGKMRKPSYFIENAKGAENRHEKLTPHMSAMIVASHVKEGMRMAEAAGIPKAIIDMIPEHHGTRMIGYFYDKAKALEDPEIEKIDPKEFVYPGPKPQTREAAILMLADVTEASVRSLKEKTSTRIQQTVQHVINDIFAESQLDECELTLKDLNDIAHAFVRILLGIYHQRIEYPKDTSLSRAPDASGMEGRSGEIQDRQSSSMETSADTISIESARKNFSSGTPRKI